MNKIFNFITNLFKKKEEPKKLNFGWVRDLPDHRDYKFRVVSPRQLDFKVDLRDKFPPVYDQKNLGSCTAQGLAAAFQFEQMKQNIPNFIPSRLFIYYNERAMEGNINVDSGAMIRTGIKTMVKDGVCPEDMWGYNINKFRAKPPQKCYDEALNHQVLQYLRLTPHTLSEVKHCLMDGYPVVFGFMIYESMMTEQVARTGIVPIPSSNDKPVGGHAVLAVGYDDDKQSLIVRNSWGSSWGMNGYFYLPYWFVETPNVSADYWTIRFVE